MYDLVWRALIVLCVSAWAFLAIFTWQGAPLWAFMLYMLMTYFCFGVLFGNFMSMALESMGHIAGMAAAVINCLSTAQGTLIGALIGSFYNNTVTPIVLGFGLTSIIAMFLLRWAKRASIEHQRA